ncbi:MFS transporter [Mycoplasma sp. P36-A1]|uniref:MFS transporter n=1 Tax=Mycoplasma sp. P36-A1 TaxID=3252900 RepID=UPI003C2E63E5
MIVNINNNKLLNISYSSLQALYWMLFCSLSAFASIFLLANNLENNQIGIILASCNIISAVSQPILSKIINSKCRLTLKSLLLYSSILLFFCTLLMIIFNDNLVIKLIAYILAFILIYSIQPFVNALGFDYANSGHEVNFGFSRAIGSLAFAVASFIIGNLIAIYTINIFAYIILFEVIIFCLIIYILPNQVHTVEKTTIHSKNFFATYPQVTLVLIGTMFLFIFHTFIVSYLSQIVSVFNGDSSTVGTLLTIAAISELPAMIFYEKLLKYKNSQFWMFLSAVFYLIRSIIIYTAISIAMVGASQLLQSLSFALFTASSAYYINSVLKPDDRIFGQTILMVSITVGCVFGNLIGGQLLLSYGVSTMLLVGIIASTLAVVFIGIGCNKRFYKQK